MNRIYRIGTEKPNPLIWKIRAIHVTPSKKQNLTQKIIFSLDRISRIRAHSL
jgi:hypothetical protein